MLGRGAPRAEVLTILQRGADLDAATAREMGVLLELNLVASLGDFASVGALSLEYQRLAARYPGEGRHALAAVVTTLALEESGDPSGAGRAAAVFLRERSQWAHSDMSVCFYCGLASTPLAVDIAWRTGALAPSDLAALDLSPEPAFEGGNSGTRLTRATLALAVAHDNASALAAIDAVKSAGWSGPSNDGVALLLGRAHLLAGDRETAIALLAPLSVECVTLGAPGIVERASFLLGQALDQGGDTNGACAAYQRVLAHWGNAKPRSVTADKARERSRALGCPRN
jgi:serine/threonine-protein kinase